MARQCPDRPTYLESLNEDRRATLLDMADLLRHDRSRKQTHRISRSSESPSPLKTSRSLDSTSLYMKSIWQLRHQLNALVVDHDATKQKLIESEKRCLILERELQEARHQYGVHMANMADQIEELISRSDLATRAAQQALQHRQRSDSERGDTDEKLSTLRTLLASDLARSDTIHADDDQRRHAKLLQALITPEMIEASRPPDTFVGASAVARPFTSHEFRMMESALRQATVATSQLQNQLDAVHARHERVHSDHVQKQRQWEDQKSRLNQSLTGAARRIQWLVGEKRKMAKSFASLNEYATKLEKKLLAQHDQLQKLKGMKKPTKRPKTISGAQILSDKSDSCAALKQPTQCRPDTLLEQGHNRPPAERVYGVGPPPSSPNLGTDSRQRDQVDTSRSTFANVPQFGLDQGSDSESFDDRPSLSDRFRTAINNG